MKRISLVIALLSSLPLMAHAASEPVGLVPFIGRFHILALHFPIGLLISVILIEIWSIARKSNTLEENTPPFLLLGAISAVVASALGLMLEEGGGYTGETIFWHKWLGIACSVLACLAYVQKLQWKKNPTTRNRAVYRTFLLLCVITMTAGAHKGGDLTHGKDFLNPDVMKPKEIAAQAGYFEKSVWPIPGRQVRGMSRRGKTERRSAPGLTGIHHGGRGKRLYRGSRQTG